MKIINLRYYYPTLYTHDAACAVPDELKDLLDQFTLEDYRYEAKRRYHRAFYSYEALNGIEKDILLFAPSPCELYEQKERHAALYAALLKLPEKQFRRIYANYYLGMSKAKIARIEGVNESGVSKSIRNGLNTLRKEMFFLQWGTEIAEKPLDI